MKLEGHNNFYNSVLSLCTIGAFSYSSSNLNYGVSIGRYCSLASNIKIMGAHHFPEWISTSPHFYSEDYHDTDPALVTHNYRSRRNVTIGNDGEFKHEVRQFQKPYDNQQAEQISLMV